MPPPPPDRRDFLYRDGRRHDGGDPLPPPAPTPPRWRDSPYHPPPPPPLRDHARPSPRRTASSASSEGYYRQGAGAYDRSYPDEPLGYTPSRSDRYWLEEEGGGGPCAGGRADLMLETWLALELCLLVRALQQSRLQRRTPQTSLWMPLLSRWLRMRRQGRNPALDGVSVV